MPCWVAQAQLVAELRRAQERLQGEVAAQGLALAGLAAERDACRAAAAASEERVKACAFLLHAGMGVGLRVACRAAAAASEERLQACASLLHARIGVGSRVACQAAAAASEERLKACPHLQSMVHTIDVIVVS